MRNKWKWIKELLQMTHPDLTRVMKCKEENWYTRLVRSAMLVYDKNVCAANAAARSTENSLYFLINTKDFTWLDKWIKHYFKIKYGPKLREKRRDLTQSHDKIPNTNRQFNQTKWQHENATKIFYYTTIADLLRTASWSSFSYPTGGLNRFACAKPFH